MSTENAESNGTQPVGPRIRALREAEGLSLRDLADRSGVSAPMLSQVERGETSPTLSVAVRIAAGLELAADDPVFDHAAQLHAERDGKAGIDIEGHERGTAPQECYNRL